MTKEANIATVIKGYKISFPYQVSISDCKGFGSPQFGQGTCETVTHELDAMEPFIKKVP
jgi:hypothetical protein